MIENGASQETAMETCHYSKYGFKNTGLTSQSGSSAKSYFQ
jgi:hypothetical protein